MSVAAVKVTKNTITIGADSILVSGWTQEKDKLAKLNKVNGMVIGDVGDFGDDNYQDAGQQHVEMNQVCASPAPLTPRSVSIPTPKDAVSGSLGLFQGMHVRVVAVAGGSERTIVTPVRRSRRVKANTAKKQIFLISKIPLFLYHETCCSWSFGRC